MAKKTKPPIPADPPRPGDDALFVDVHTRLYRADVEYLKAEARDAGETNWQPRLRLLVRDSVKARRAAAGRVVR